VLRQRNGKIILLSNSGVVLPFIIILETMPPHVHIDRHHDDLQAHQYIFLNDLNYEQSPLFQDDLSVLTSRTGTSPLDALRNDDFSIICDGISSVTPVKPEVKRTTGIEAIIGCESRYYAHQYEIAETSMNNSSSSSSTVVTASTSTTTAASTAAHGSSSGGKKFSQKVNSALFPKDSLQRRKQIAGFFRKGKKVASSIVNKKKSSKKNP
jgi:hypothetical protein